MKKFLSTFILLLAVFKLSAQVKIYCDDVEMADTLLAEVTYVQAIETRIGGTFEACEFKMRDELIVPTDFHPFVASLYIAYADHRPISISPDMIWLLICQGFSSHVNNNVEELREKFVAFDDKKKLIVKTEPISLEFVKGSIKSPWPLTFPVMADSISKYVKSDMHDLFVQSFSTTTFVEKSAYEVALFEAMSGYFEYEVSTACGIPIINIEGTKADWLQIKKNLKRLKGYNIDKWINALEPIIQQFVDASENKIDHEFWQNMFKRKDESGGPYITGWIIKFFPYSNLGRINPYLDKEPDMFQGLLTNQFNNGLSKADFIWNYFNTNYEMEFLAGFVGIKQDKKTLTLRPEIGWLVKDKYVQKKVEVPIEVKTIIEVDERTKPDWKMYLLVLFSGLLIGFLVFKVIRRRKN